jgi:hypothetical protein
MLDQEAAWWAKLRRAKSHRQALTGLVEDFKATEPYTLTAEETDGQNTIGYRLRILRQVPADLTTVIGDLIHNLRSALDAVAFELARQSVGRDLTDEEERATEFPVCADPASFAEFFGEGSRPRAKQRIRGDLYNKRARQALRKGQSWIWAMEPMWRVDDETRARKVVEEFEWDSLRRVWHLSNVDKHRRLTAVGVGWPSLFYFGSDEGDTTQFRGGHWPPADNTILMYLVGPQAREKTLQCEFALVLEDDPMHTPDKPYEPHDALNFLDGCIQEVAVTIQQVLVTYDHLGTGEGVEAATD